LKAILLAIALLAGCGPGPTREQRAIQIAYAHAQARFHYDRNIERQPPTVDDRGDRWFITFHNAPGTIGGNVMVEIRKSDLIVLESMADQ
jgi:hypothetical protein